MTLRPGTPAALSALRGGVRQQVPSGAALQRDSRNRHKFRYSVQSVEVNKLFILYGVGGGIRTLGHRNHNPFNDLTAMRMFLQTFKWWSHS
jgi:hypothetical protein